MTPDFAQQWGPLFPAPMPPPDFAHFGAGPPPPDSGLHPPPAGPKMMGVPTPSALPPAPMPPYWPTPMTDPRLRQLADTLAAFGQISPPGAP